MTVVAVVGAGLAGLVAARTAVEHGADVLLFEQEDEPGGTSRLASGWIWRYRDLATFQRAAPHGDERVQAAVWNALAEALPWLEREGARIVGRGTHHADTDGVRVEMPQVVDSLARRLPDGALRCGERLVDARPLDDGVQLVVEGGDGERREVDAAAVVFAGGGYAAALERVAQEAGVEREVRTLWARRNAGLSDGSALDVALGLGAHRVPVTGESYARAMPVEFDAWPDDYLHAAQLDDVQLVGADGCLLERAAHDWSGSARTWQLARTAGAGWYVFDRAALTRVLAAGTAAKAIAEARAMGARIVESAPGGMCDALAAVGVEPRTGVAKALANAVCAVAVRPGITHTLCGLRVDERACCGDPARRGLLARASTPGPTSRLFAAGVEAGGVANGGYASGLAQALTLGRIAGREAAGLARS